MSNKSIHYIVSPTTLLAPASYTSTQTSAAYDREAGPSGDIGAPYEALEILIDAGAWTSGTFTFSLEDSPDNSTYTANTTDIVGVTPTISSSGTASKVYRFSYTGMERYVKIVATGASTPSAVFGVIAMGAYPRNLPTVASGS